MTTALRWRRNRSLQDFRGRHKHSEPTLRRGGCNRDKASKLQHRRVTRRRENVQAKTARLRSESLEPPPAEIVDERIPVVMKSFARIEMLVERRTIEACQTVRIGRKMSRHPIEDDADFRAMEFIDEARETLR